MARLAPAEIGILHSINVSGGGIPKCPRAAARISRDGVEGDAQRDLRYHGGPDRAVSLYSFDLIEALRAEGHPISVGTTGENLTVAGLTWSKLAPGVQLEIGEVALELTQAAVPCMNIAASFRSAAIARISAKLHPGWSRFYARVLREGMVAVGDQVRRFA